MGSRNFSGTGVGAGWRRIRLAGVLGVLGVLDGVDGVGSWAFPGEMNEQIANRTTARGVSGWVVMVRIGMADMSSDQKAGPALVLWLNSKTALSSALFEISRLPRDFQVRSRAEFPPAGARALRR